MHTGRGGGGGVPNPDNSKSGNDSKFSEFTVPWFCLCLHTLLHLMPVRVRRYPSNLTVSKNAGIEPRAVAEFALTVRTVSTVL